MPKLEAVTAEARWTNGRIRQAWVEPFGGGFEILVQDEGSEKVRQVYIGAGELGWWHTATAATGYFLALSLNTPRTCLKWRGGWGLEELQDLAEACEVASRKMIEWQRTAPSPKRRRAALALGRIRRGFRRQAARLEALAAEVPPLEAPAVVEVKLEALEAPAVGGWLQGLEFPNHQPATV